jgi:hypothetical protein
MRATTRYGRGLLAVLPTRTLSRCSREELTPSDLAEIDAIEVTASMLGRDATVTFRRPPRTSQQQEPPPVVSLQVSGPDREWVHAASDSLSKVIDTGIPGEQKVFRWLAVAAIVLMGSGGAIAAIARITGPDALVVVGWVILATGGGFSYSPWLQARSCRASNAR